jgi:phosphate transport system substrate-binding protein
VLKKLLIATTCLISTTALARDNLQIAGSSTVLPYASIVAEQFGKAFSKFKTPIVESGGSSAGLKQFCQGIGPSTIDIANSSRKMKASEVKACASKGVTNIVEIKFGYDGIVFAVDKSAGQWELTPKDLYLALANKVPVNGKMVDNPNKTWKDVNSSLPAFKIKAFIPGEKHGTREVFEEKVLAIGCKTVGGLDLYKKSGLDKKKAHKACIQVRKDGGATDIDGDYTETLARIKSNKKAVGVFGLAFYEANNDKLKVATVNGVKASVDTVASGKYPVSRPLFFYVKKQHLGMVPGLREYVKFFTSTKMIGEDGPLAEYGLVPLPEKEFNDLQKIVKGM